MIELHSQGSYELIGRGPVMTFGEGVLLAAGVRNPKDLMTKPRQPVIIDGVECFVIGVEHWAIVCEGECSHPVGLLVGPKISIPEDKNG